MSNGEISVAAAIPRLLSSSEYVCRHTVLPNEKISLSHGDKLVEALKARGWLTPKYEAIHGVHGKYHYLYAFSGKFIQVASETSTGVITHTGKDASQLFQTAITSRDYMERYAPSSEGAKHSAATYAASILLLSEVADPTSYGDWLTGRAGWEALVAYEAIEPYPGIMDATIA